VPCIRQCGKKCGRVSEARGDIMATRITCCTPNSAEPQLKYVSLFQCNDGCKNAPSCYFCWYITCLVANTGCPTRYPTRHFCNNFTTNEDIATKFEADLPHCVRNVTTTKVLLFKFRYNIVIGVRIINLLSPEFYI
jgi:hypothetical protein